MYHPPAPPAGPPQLKWSSLLLREDSQGTRAAISRRLDCIEKLIRGRVPSPGEIVQKCDDRYKDGSSLKTTIQTTLLLLIHASIKTGKMGWLKNESLHYRLQLLDVEPKGDAPQLQHELHSSTIEILKKFIASERHGDSKFMAQPLEPPIHNEPSEAMWNVGGLCQSSGSAMMRTLFYIATAYTVPSNLYHADSIRKIKPCKDTECSHIDCQYARTWPREDGVQG